jgi:hypothetical protein
MKISNVTFQNEEVILDFHEYHTCNFISCRFVILGYGPFALNGCEITTCEFSFAGPALNTVQTLGTIYNSFGEQGKALVEGAFNGIRNTGGQSQ